MRIALISDVHGNREAFEAVLSAVEREDVGRIVLLGDLVGYGADPAWCVERCAELVEAGAVAVKGNHDAAAVTGPGPLLNPAARASLLWTREALEQRHRDFLAALPMAQVDGERLYTHASPVEPGAWLYVRNAADAEQALASVAQRVVLIGHHHRPAVYSQAPDQAALGFTPGVDAPIPLLARRRWLAVIGACGQPRDENPAAPYAILDVAARSLCFRRAPYDVAAAARKIEAAGLPASLAERLFVGR